MTRAEIKKKVYSEIPIPKDACADRKRKLEKLRFEAIEKYVKHISKKEYK